MAEDDRKAAFKPRVQALQEEIRQHLPDTAGHRERMERIRNDRKLLIAMVPTAQLRTALHEGCGGVCGDPVDRDRSAERLIWDAASTVIREWTLFLLDLRNLAREDPEHPPLTEDVQFRLDETLFRPIGLPNRMSAMHRRVGGVMAWREHLHGSLTALLPPNLSRFAVLLIEGLSESLRAAIERNGGELKIRGWLIRREVDGYSIGYDPTHIAPPASSS